MPEAFLTGLVTNICGGREAKDTAEPTNISSALDTRYDILESKVNSLSVTLEKFDIQCLAEDLTNLGSKLESTNNNMISNIKAVGQLGVDPEKNQSVLIEELQEKLKQQRKDLEFTQKELSATRNSNELLLKIVGERDTSITTLRDRLERSITKSGEKDKHIAILELETKSLSTLNAGMTGERSDLLEQWSLKVQASNRERDGFAQQLEESNGRYRDIENEHKTLLESSSLLKEQLKEVTKINKSLKNSKDHHNYHPADDESSRRERDGDNDDNNSESGRSDESEEVVILHDSLCRKVNNTLLSREKVQVRKVFSPDFDAMEETLDNTQSKVIVLESLTRDLHRMNIDDIKQRIDDVVSKALTKADKVVISTIVNRKDIADIDIKAGRVNLYIEEKYRTHESVVICDNGKLYGDEFRGRDKLHLSDRGVSAFASNLKYAIAEALGVRVEEKRFKSKQRFDYDDRQRFDNYDRRSRYNNYRSEWS